MSYNVLTELFDHITTYVSMCLMWAAILSWKKSIRLLSAHESRYKELFTPSIWKSIIGGQGV